MDAGLSRRARDRGLLSRPDFGVDDWKGISAAEIERRALLEATRSRGGVVIIHETKPHMVEELPALIVAWEKLGYRIVQVVPAPGARELAAQKPDALIHR